MLCQVKMIGHPASGDLGVLATATDEIQAEFSPEPVARIVPRWSSDKTINS